ncbi:hypothetical protein WA026_006356, partial [Henosepilachna vigintioctopunctata]
ITLPPERRTGLIRSLGPLSQCILLANESMYKNELENALKEKLSMLDITPGIISCLSDANSPWEVSGMLGDLGDLLVLTTARSTQKFYFPFAVLIALWESRNK